MDPQLYRRFFEIEDWFWWCVGTRRVFFELIEKTGVRGRAIDIGCGTGAAVQEFPRGWNLVTGCDYSPLALSFCRERGLRELVRCTGTELPFTTGSFDVVMAIDVIEHLDDDVACVREMARICRPGGYVLAHVPAFESLWTDKDDVNHHRRRYRRQQLIRLMEDCGLAVQTSFYLNSILFPVALLRALGQKIRGQFGTPPPPSAAGIDHLYNLPGVVNRLMTGLMAFEHRVVKPLSLPFGMSVVSLGRKTAA
jgi:SAM-dependent methyltransferase